MGELWLMGTRLIGLPIRHCVRREGGGEQRSIAARKHVRESYGIRLMTAAGDVFGNLILTQSNSVIVLPQDWTQSSWANSITAVESCCVLAAGVSRGSSVVLSLIFNSCTMPWKCIKLFILSGNLTNILGPKTSFSALSGLDIDLGWLLQIDTERIRLVDILSAAQNFIAVYSKPAAHLM